MVGHWRFVKETAAVAIAIAAASAALASTLEVTPILIDVMAAGSSASVITLRNRGANPANVQVRIMRWRQTNGTDTLERDTSVVASPPFATLAPNSDYAMRIVRTDKRPIVGEESYRLLIDELPAPRQPDGSVRLAIRYSIPVFFRSPHATQGDVRWSLLRKGDSLSLFAINHGERRTRISNLRLVNGSGASVSFGAGLAGYALGGSGRSWTVANVAPSFSVKDAHVVFASEAGPQSVAVEPQTEALPASPAPSS